MKKITRLKDVGNYIFSGGDNSYWVAEYFYESGDIRWARCDKRGNLVYDNDWHTWSADLKEISEVIWREKRDIDVPDMIYKIRFLEQKFLNRELSPTIYNSW